MAETFDAVVALEREAPLSFDDVACEIRRRFAVIPDLAVEVSRASWARNPSKSGSSS